MSQREKQPPRLGQWLGLGATLALGGVVARAVYNVYQFEVNRFTLTLAKLERPLHVVHLSDLHYGLTMWGGSVAAWVGATMQLRPDLIVITGDFIQSRPFVNPAPLADLLEPLEAPLGVWGIWGNHDHAWYSEVPHRLRRTLARAGIEMLENRGVRLRDDLFLAGIDDLGKGHQDIGAALEQRPEDAATLFLCHRPETLAQLPKDLDLCLSGHTHGGQVRVGPIKEMAAATVGWQDGLPRAYVSSGLGVGLTPLRWNCKPEIVSLKLEPG